MIIIANTSNGRNSVKVVGQSADVVVRCGQFQHWLDTFDFENLDLRLVSIQSADIFQGGKVIFVKMEAEVFDRATNKPLPGIVFLRGNSVTALIFVESIETGEVFVLVVHQARIPAGSSDFCELVAGTMDKNDGIVGRTIEELKEEAGIVLTRDDLKRLGDCVPSTGGCDEHIASFFARKSLSQQQISHILSVIHGEKGTDESIKLELLSIQEFVTRIADGRIVDGKALSTVTLLLLKYSPKMVIELLAQASKQLFS